jgi:hypothetical protein
MQCAKFQHFFRKRSLNESPSSSGSVENTLGKGNIPHAAMHPTTTLTHPDFTQASDTRLAFSRSIQCAILGWEAVVTSNATLGYHA